MPLQTTPSLAPESDPQSDPQHNTSKPLLSERFKAYADAPNGTERNKYLVYQTHDIDHSINLLMRMVEKGWKIRAAYHQFADGRTIRIEQHTRQAGLINANK